MITTLQFQGVNGINVDLDTDAIPLTTFDIQAETRREDRLRTTQHGQFPTKEYLDKMTIHMEGKLFGDDTSDYWARRMNLLGAFMPRPDRNFTYCGTLIVKFDGISENVQTLCSLDGKPVLPLAALYPEGSDFAISLQSDDPFFYSTTEYNVQTGTPNTVPNGFTFNFSFNFSFGGGSTASAVVIPNLGNTLAYPIVDIYGPCTNPGIANGTRKLVFNGLSLGSNEYVEIDFAKRTAITNTGGSAYSLLDDNSQWWVLDPGNNTVTYSAFSASSPSLARIRWRNAYFL
jgi:Phage-related protein